jgi:predicted Zn-dependent protease
MHGIVCIVLSLVSLSGEQTKETAMGAQLAAEVRRHSTPLGARAVDNYVANLGLRLAAQMTNRPASWTFSVITDQAGGATHEPISLPGGWIFVPAQLILEAHSEAEFAGMLAHAMAHVTLKQMTRRTANPVADLANIPLVFLGGYAGLGGDDRHQLIPRALVPRQREFELEADAEAVQAMSGAGFDAESLPGYVERTQGRMVENDFSPLPPAAVRVGNLERALEGRVGNGPYVVSTDLFQEVQEAVQREMADVAIAWNTRSVPSLLRPKR